MSVVEYGKLVIAHDGRQRESGIVALGYVQSCVTVDGPCGRSHCFRSVQRLIG